MATTMALYQIVDNQHFWKNKWLKNYAVLKNSFWFFRRSFEFSENLWVVAKGPRVEGSSWINAFDVQTLYEKLRCMNTYLSSNIAQKLNADN